jgi:DNA-binding GntR family transcriptional regulator
LERGRRKLKPTKSEVYNQLKSKIIMQQLKAGEVLNEKQLMAQYNIGRTPLREIFTELQREELIQRFPRSGTIVAPMDFNQLKEATEIRIPLEAVVGELVVDRIKKEQLQQLRSLIKTIKNIEKTGDEADIIQGDTQLHNLLYTATGNRKLINIIHGLQGISARFWFALTFTREEYVDQLKQWGYVLEAIENKDKKKTKELLQNHVQKFMNQIKSKL